MRIGFKTTFEEEMIKRLKIDAIEKQINVNDILEMLIKRYLEADGGYYQTIYMSGDKGKIKKLEKYLLTTKFVNYEIQEGPEYNRDGYIHFTPKKEIGLITLEKKEDSINIIRLDAFYGRTLLPEEYSRILINFFNECIRDYAEDEENEISCIITDLYYKLIPGWNKYE